MEHFLWVYSLVQGISEALPVSSSFHIRLLAFWMHHPASLALESALHIGTGLAFCGMYPSSVWKIFLGFRDVLKKHYTTQEAKWWIFTTLASLPVLALGGVMHMLHIRLQRIEIIAVLGAVFSVLLWWCDGYGPRLYSLPYESFQKGWIKRAFILGLFQMCALFPGVSRLGACLLACRYLGYSRRESLRISISLGVIAILACVTLEASQWRNLNFSLLMWGQVMSITYFSCCLALGLFRRYIHTVSFLWFFIYRCVLAALVVYSCYSLR